MHALPMTVYQPEQPPFFYQNPGEKLLADNIERTADELIDLLNEF